MSFARTYLPVGFAIVFGVVNGVYAFKPYLEEQKESKDRTARERLEKTQQQNPPSSNIDNQK
ncbi:hypothetical protein GGR57DRAFT_463582 [Xylariaceae sp. FL1272]|nr:hypothetical protein GGR57DRAFT_463582 [Xylariaceae sp. FL1272]